MIKAGQKKIAFLKQYRDISDEVMCQLKEVMHPLDEKREAQRYWDRMRHDARLAAIEAEKNRNVKITKDMKKAIRLRAQV